MSQLGTLWYDSPHGWRWTTADGRFDSKAYNTKLAAERAMKRASRPADDKKKD